MPTKALSRAAIAKLLEDRRKSFPARVEARARSVFLQREIRQKMLQHLKEAEQHHIGMSISPMGMHDESLTRAPNSIMHTKLVKWYQIENISEKYFSKTLGTIEKRIQTGILK